MSDLRFGVFEKSTGKSCSLRHIHYDCRLEDSFLRTLMTQEFENARDMPVELVYKFAQNDQSTIHDIEVELYDPIKETRRVLVAEIEKKQVAQERYDDAVATGDSAMLAESDEKDPGIISLSLGNVGAKWQVAVRLSSVEDVPVEHVEQSQVRMRVLIPSLNRSGSELEGVGVENSSIELNIGLTENSHSLGGDVARIIGIHSASHDQYDIFQSEIGSDGLTASIRTKEDRRLSMNRDVIIEIDVENMPLVSGLIEDSTAVVSVVPVFDATEMPLCTEIVVVVDCSGSMSGSRIRCAKGALEAFFRRLYDQGKGRQVFFNIVRFGTSHESLFSDGSRLLDHKTHVRAQKYIQNQVESNLGGTRMLPPLTEILTRDVVREGFSRQVMFLTDGEDQQTDQVIRFARSHCGTTRIFSFGIGRGINPVLITRIAQVSNGRAVFIGESAVIEERIIEQMKFVMQPSLTGIRVRFADSENEMEVEAKNYLSAIPPCFNYQKYSLYFRLESDRLGTETDVIVEFAFGGGPVETQKMSLRPVTNHLNTLGARRRVLELGDDQSKPQAGDEESKREIEELGLSGHFITSQTSFIMVAEAEDAEALGSEMDIEVIAAVVPKDPEPESTVRRRRGGKSSSSSASSNWRNVRDHGRLKEKYGSIWDADESAAPSFAAPARARARPRARARRGGCFANSNRVKILRQGVPMTVCLGMVREGDLVESCRGVGRTSTKCGQDLSMSYDLCIGLCHHLSPLNCYVFETANGATVGMTGIHLVQIRRENDAPESPFVCRMAKEIRVGDWILVKEESEDEEGDACVVPSQIVSISHKMETVSMVYTKSSVMIVSGIVCSCFSKQTRFKPFHAVKWLHYSLPKWARSGRFSRLLDGFVYEMFIREDSSKIRDVVYPVMMKIHDVVGGYSEEE